MASIARRCSRRSLLSRAVLLASVRSVVPELLRATGVPGLAASYIGDGQVAWTKEFGLRSAQSQLRVDKDTVFEAASLSKPAFAYVVLQLVDGGKLKLDAPLTDYLDIPWIPNEPRLVHRLAI